MFYVSCLFIGMTLISVFTITKKALHMYQQNGYDKKRYNTWMSENPRVLSNFEVFYFFIAVIITLVSLQENNITLFFSSIGYMLIILDIYIRFIIEEQQEYVKPLHVTNRVKRQIVTYLLIHIIFYGVIVWAILNNYNVLLLSVIVITYQMLIPYEIIIVGFLNNPIEKMGREKFKREAKQIIKEHKDLVKIAITGSYGKTSSKNVMQEILSEKYYSLMTPRSFNTAMGITITIREYLKPLHEIFVCEMGTDKLGTINELMDIVHPQYGIITSIGPQHINTIGSMENIIKEKFSVVEGLPSDGIAVLNYDNEYIRNYKIKNTCKVVTFGIESEDVTYRVRNIKYHRNGSDFEILLNNDWYPFTTKLLGTHNIYNILCAVALGYELGIDVSSLQVAVKRVNYVEHRLEVKKQGNLTLIDNAFNSNPVGSKMSVEVLGQMEGQRILITPGMIDLGEEEDEYNYKFGTYMKDHVDIVILVGKVKTEPIYRGLIASGFNMTNVYTENSTKAAFEKMYTLAKENATVLIENDLPDAFNK